MDSVPHWSTAWITGASTGIGRELALRLAASGVRVAATARSIERLNELVALSPNIIGVPADVTVPAQMLSAYEAAVAGVGPIDLAILNAGVWHVMDAQDYDARLALESMAVNYGGIVNALAPLVPAMLARRRGHIAVMASVAGYRGLPKAIAYGPTKAAAISLAEILRIDLAPRGITVSLINPGFVETPMTASNNFPMPFMLKTEDAADRILRGLAKGKFEIAFPWQTVTSLKFLRALPNAVYLAIAGLMANRGSE